MSTITPKWKRKKERDRLWGWANSRINQTRIVSPGHSSEVTNLLFSKTSLHDYENLCSLDCLAVEENHVKSDDLVYDKFRKQLGRNSQGYYETNLT